MVSRVKKGTAFDRLCFDAVITIVFNFAIKFRAMKFILWKNDCRLVLTKIIQLIISNEMFNEKKLTLGTS